MVAILKPYCLLHQKPKTSSRQQHESAKKENPKSLPTVRGLESRAKSLLLPVAGEFFLLTLPFIERAYKVAFHYPSYRGFPTYQELACWNFLKTGLLARTPVQAARITSG